jgi:hypothetical protein
MVTVASRLAAVLPVWKRADEAVPTDPAERLASGGGAIW